MGDETPIFTAERLQTLCLDTIALNLSATVCRCIPPQGLLVLREGLCLPAEICEGIFRSCIENGVTMDDKVMHMFRDRRATQLVNADFTNSMITDWSLQWLSEHPVMSLDISGCQELSGDSVQYINQMAPSLQALFLGNRADLYMKDAKAMQLCYQREASFVTNFYEIQDDEPMEPMDLCMQSPIAEDGEDEVIINAPNLRRLSAHGLVGDNAQSFLILLLQRFSHLQHLDLSCCGDLKLNELPCLALLDNLESLVLYNALPVTFDLEEYLPVLRSLGHLRHLDLSMSKKRSRHGPAYPSFTSQDKALAELLSSLSHLVSLDISGTHLAGLGPEECRSGKRAGEGWCDKSNSSPIVGLTGRHLEFLGLLSCQHNPCSRPNLPADRVTGDATIEQVMESLRVYLARGEFCSEALTSLYHMLKDNQNCVSDRAECLRLVSRIMRRHMSNLDRQISGSAAMFYLIRTNKIHHFASVREIRITVKILYDAMDTHFGDKAMLRNGLLTLCHFNIPEDVLFMYKDVVTILLQTIRQCNLQQDEFIQRIAIYILNSLVCRVDFAEKLLVGDRGAVKTMLWLIKAKLELGEVDEILEMAWSTLWNITDETPKNCQRFLEGDGEQEGLQLFLQCYSRFCEGSETSRDSLLRNMMGLLGNVAEVSTLRSCLGPVYLNLFRKLLHSSSDGIEVSYNAAGILCHVASDGEDLCSAFGTMRSEVMAELVDVIRKWDLNAQRSINYRSFRPIMRLLECDHTVEVRHWAVWALCNLTNVYPTKYCALLKKEGGIDLLNRLIWSQPEAQSADVRQLAQRIIENCQREAAGTHERSALYAD